MAYPEDALASHEELILKLHPHWWYIAKAAMALVATVIVGSWIGFAVLDSSVLRTVIGIAILAEVVWFVERLVRWTSIFFVLTSDRVMSREGIIAKRGIEIPLARINTVMFEQRIFERLLGLGNLVIESASTDGSQTFSTVRQPDEIQKQIYVQMEASSNRQHDRLGQAIAGASPGTPPGVGPAGPGGASITDQINELAALRDQGHLTEDEFQAKKNELLDRM